MLWMSTLKWLELLLVDLGFDVQHFIKYRCYRI